MSLKDSFTDWLWSEDIAGGWGRAAAEKKKNNPPSRMKKFLKFIPFAALLSFWLLDSAHNGEPWAQVTLQVIVYLVISALPIIAFLYVLGWILRWIDGYTKARNEDLATRIAAKLKEK